MNTDTSEWMSAGWSEHSSERSPLSVEEDPVHIPGMSIEASLGKLGGQYIRWSYIHRAPVQPGSVLHFTNTQNAGHSPTERNMACA